jgi:hypothetical protein
MSTVPELVAEFCLEQVQVWLRCLSVGIGSHDQAAGKG